jgi:hypothetical protein
LTTNNSLFKGRMILNLLMLIIVTVFMLVVLMAMPKNAEANTVTWSTYGGDWTGAGTEFSVSYGQGSPAEQRQIAINTSMFTDVSIEAEISNITGGNAGFLFRVNNPQTEGYGSDKQNGYYVGIDPTGTQLSLGKTNISSYSPIIAVTPELQGQAHHLKVVMIGDSIKVFFNGKLEIDVIDNTYTVGMVGLRTYATAATYSNLIIKSDFTAPTTSTSQFIDEFSRYVTVNLEAEDSSSTTTHYKVNNGSPLMGNSFVLNTAGIHLITYWSMDQEGNTEYYKHKIIKVDLSDSENVGKVNIFDVVKLLSQQNQNGIGVFSIHDIQLMLGAISPINSIQAL